MNNTILITGCTHGLGRELALQFANEYASVYAVGRNEDLLNDLTISAPVIIPIIADVATSKGREIIFESVKKEKSISIIHNAAIAIPSLINDLSEELLKKHFETNFFAPILLNQKLQSLLKKNSRVLNISSAAAEFSIPGLMPYCTSKGALEHMANCFNAEFNSKEIYFANLRPGMVDTQMQEQLRNADKEKLPGKKFYVAAKKDNKLTPPAAVAKFVLWVMTKTDNETFSKTLWDITSYTQQ